MSPSFFLNSFTINCYLLQLKGCVVIDYLSVLLVSIATNSILTIVFSIVCITILNSINISKSIRGFFPYRFFKYRFMSMIAFKLSQTVGYMPTNEYGSNSTCIGTIRALFFPKLSLHKEELKCQF